jgi:hypothetical protein
MWHEMLIQLLNRSPQHQKIGLSIYRCCNGSSSLRDELTGFGGSENDQQTLGRRALSIGLMENQFNLKQPLTARQHNQNFSDLPLLCHERFTSAGRAVILKDAVKLASRPPLHALVRRSPSPVPTALICIQGMLAHTASRDPFPATEFLWRTTLMSPCTRGSTSK